MVVSMRPPINLLRKFSRDDRGATAVEYGLLLALITLAVLAAVTLLGQSLSGFFQSLATRTSTWAR